MLKDEIEENQGVDIQEKMIAERREWVNQYKESHNGKIPDDLAEFKNRFDVETPLSPDEEGGKKDDEDGGKKKKKGGEAKKKGGKKGKKAKGGGDDDGAPAAQIYISEIIQKFDLFYDDYNEDWNTRDETDNYKQEHDVEMAKTEVMPILKTEYEG